jgi:hypothetical protein
VLLPKRGRDYKAFWAKAREVAGLFRTVYLPREERERLWREYSDLCARVKEFGSAERDEKRARSAVNVDRVRSLVHEAEMWARGAKETAHLVEARSHLRQAMDLLQAEVFLHEHRQECWTIWKKTADEITMRRTEMQETAYEGLDREITALAPLVDHGNTFEAVARLKGLQQEIRSAELSRDQRRWLQARLGELWVVVILRIEARKSEWARVREERGQRREVWRDHQVERIERLTEWRDRNEEFMGRLQDEADEIEGQIANAWNEDWAERARGWVQAKYAKIRDLERRNEEIEAKILEIRRRLDR